MTLSSRIKDFHEPVIPPVPPRRTVFGRGSYAESLRIGEILRKETVGGALLARPP